MDHPVFRVYVGLTDTVIEELKVFNLEEIGIANDAVLNLLNLAARDANEKKLKTQYVVTFENLEVAATARLDGKRLYVVIVHVGIDGDWDPNGGKGLDQIAYSKIHEVAKAFVTFINGRPNFRWMKRKPVPSGNPIPAEMDLGLPPSIPESVLHSYSRVHLLEVRRHDDYEKSSIWINYSAKDLLASILGSPSRTSRPIQVQNAVCLHEPQKESPKIDFMDSRLCARPTKPLPQGLQSLVYVDNARLQKGASCSAPDDREPPFI